MSSQRFSTGWSMACSRSAYGGWQMEIQPESIPVRLKLEYWRKFNSLDLILRLIKFHILGKNDIKMEQ